MLVVDPSLQLEAGVLLSKMLERVKVSKFLGIWTPSLNSCTSAKLIRYRLLDEGVSTNLLITRIDEVVGDCVLATEGDSVRVAVGDSVEGDNVGDSVEGDNVGTVDGGGTYSCSPEEENKKVNTASEENGKVVILDCPATVAVMVAPLIRSLQQGSFLLYITTLSNAATETMVRVGSESVGSE